MRIRASKKLKDLNLKFRMARIEDSEILSLLEHDYLSHISRLDYKRSPKNFRVKIGSGILHGEGILVVEDRTGIFGFIEHKKHLKSYAKLGFPFVDRSHPRCVNVQQELIRQIVENLKGLGTKFVFTEYFDGLEEAKDLFGKFNFSKPQSIFQAWDGTINPNSEIDLGKYEIRRVKKMDYEICYQWLKEQLNQFSPLFITEDTFKSLITSSNGMKDGWAMATYENQPVCFVSSLIDQSSKAVIIFGPFNDPKHVSARIPLLNELLLYHKLQGRDMARIMRIKELTNDAEIFMTFGFVKTEEINLMTRVL